MAGVIIFAYTFIVRQQGASPEETAEVGKYRRRQKNGNAGSKQYKKSIYNEIWRK